jgi:diaminopimelate epimerase
MEQLFPISFTKMSGTGNDFIIIDHRDRFIPVDLQAEFTRKVCRRMFSAGADGVILIENSDEADFRWRFYNSDGSIPEMCGNGARCAARFAYRLGIAGEKMRFQTVAGIIEAEICAGEEVRIRMTDPFDLKNDIILFVGGQERQADFINTGVPHAVLFVEQDNAPVKEWGREIRFHHMFEPDGTNATYERGVEDETRACGTGAVASAIIASIKKKCESPVTVRTSGGDRLTIEFELKSEGRVENVFLTGPARIIYTGALTAESMQ